MQSVLATPILLMWGRGTGRETKQGDTAMTRTTIKIGTQEYGVEPLLGPRGCGPTWRLSKADGEVYDVSRDDYELVVCTCPHYEFRLRGNSAGPCKHGKALIGLGLIEQPIPRRHPVAPEPIRYRGSNGHWYDDPREAARQYTFSPGPGESC